MTPAETLRAAARLARERAQNAEPGFYEAVRQSRQAVSMRHEDHFGAWSPPVALAIADFWEVAAQAVEETDHTSGWRWALILTAALDAARAYLGETLVS